jgi:hypothetical protein
MKGAEIVERVWAERYEASNGAEPRESNDVKSS